MPTRIIVSLIVSVLFAASSFCQKNDSSGLQQQQSDIRERIGALHRLVRSEWLKDPDLAKKYADTSLMLSQQLGDSLEVAKSLRLLGGVNYYQGDYDSSLDFNFRSLEIGLRINDSVLVNKCYNNIGLLYYDLGSYQTSLEYLLRAKEIKEKLGETNLLGTTLNNIGLVFDRASNYPQARSYFNQALTIAKEYNIPDVLIYSLNNIGIAYRKEGNFELALHYFDSALNLAEETENINWGAVSHRNIGEIMRYNGQYDSAKKLYEKSLVLSESIDDKKGITEVYSFLAKLALDQGRIESSTNYLDKSHEIAKAIKLRFQLLENLRLYANIHLVDNKRREVIVNQLKYLDLRDSLFKEEVSRNLTMVPIKLKEEGDRIRLSSQQAELRSKDAINRIYIFILIGSIPLFGVLIFLLRKNRMAFRDLKRNNDELKKTQNLLVTAEKMASLGVLAAGVGHEINNPLNYIKNGLNALSKKVGKENKELKTTLQKYFDIINEGVERASTIVKSLGHFSRAGDSREELCDVRKILENCLIILGGRLKKVEVEKDLARKKAIIHGNEGKLHQVFMNIILNAAQAVPDNGKISISTKVNQDEVIISIRDNGMGIPKENLLKITDPFFTTKPPGEGTGLGLFITYAIVEEHFGKIVVESEEGIGSEFIITLPLQEVS